MEQSTGYKLGSRAHLLCTANVVAVLGLLAGSPALAQDDETKRPSSSPISPTPQQPDQKSSPDIVVTGSRAIRNGYQSPTPTTVLGADTLAALGKVNVADALNELPQLAQSVTPSAQPAGISGGSLGVNELNLRALGTSRTLILLDGRRVINSSLGTDFVAPDVNTIPSALIARVDTVTAGASAAYGSDALAGVVNFVLDRKFTGIKGEALGGVSTYGDNRQYSASLTAGTKFGPDGRVHVLLSGEVAYNAGVKGTTRPWNANNASVIVNPSWTATNGQPYYLVARQTGPSNGTPGGLITSGPLQGTAFGPGGVPANFNYGLVTSNNIMSGGDWQTTRLDNQIDMVPALLRENAFGRLSYDLTHKFEVFGEFQWSRTRATNDTVPNFLLGGAVQAKSDNPFLPSSIAARMASLGLTSVPIGTELADVGLIRAENIRKLTRWTIGLDGALFALGSNWTWDVSYQQSRNRTYSQATNDLNIGNFFLAADAVRSPTTGAAICRSTITSPGNGCVPFDVLGTGVNSQAAINYVTGNSNRNETLAQDVVAANLHGDPFSTWAGPVSIALGIEHRREAVTGEATALDEANAYFAGDYHATHGSYEVTEGYVEAAVPLAKDTAWAKSLDVNGAVRGTGYSTSGYVTTWKVGGVYAPVADIRFRATRSRDIRAPNLGELFAAGQSATGAPLHDPFTNSDVANSIALASGNARLKPEVASTTEFGAVFSPSFIPNFQASVDYYDINITGAVEVPKAQTVVDLCYQGNTALCSDIQRTNGVISLVVTSPSNIAAVKTRGLDFEATYRLPLSKIVPSASGVLTLRALGTYVISLKSFDSSGVTEGADVLGGRFGAFGSTISTGLSAPRFVTTGFINYDGGALSAQAVLRHVGGGVYNNLFTACASACPTGSQYTINDNHISPNTTLDLSITYRPFRNGGSSMFAVVDNVFNTSPPVIGGNTINTYYLGQANSDYYDRIGRTFRVGFRFKY